MWNRYVQDRWLKHILLRRFIKITPLRIGGGFCCMIHLDMKLFTRFELFYLSIWSALFIWIWKRMLFFDGTYFWTNSTNIWGDWSLHFVYIYNFLYRSFPLTSHPILSQEPFRYHFIADLLSAIFMKLGASLITATIIPSILCSILLIFTVFLFYKQIFRNSCVSFVAPLIFFFTGGLGFLYQLVLHKPQSFTELTHIPELGILWINPITAEFIPQRAFLLGLPITLLILTYYWRCYKTNFASISPTALFAIGIISGFFPIIHYHSFYVLLIFALYTILLMLLAHKKIFTWIWFFIPMLVVSYIINKVFIGSISPMQNIVFKPGWLAPQTLAGYSWFWINNIGIMSILIPISYFYLPKSIKIYSIPFIFLFIISNIFIFQSQPFDNRKFLIYWYVFSSGSVAYLISKILHKYPRVGYMLAILLFYTSIVSGLIDVISIPREQSQLHRLFSIHDIEFARQIRLKTNSETVFLTYPANSWLGMVLGRQVIMGFDYWLPNYGFETKQRKQDIEAMYGGNQNTQQLLKYYHVDYIIIGPNEKRYTHINETYFQRQFPILLQNDETTIYDVRETKFLQPPSQ